MPSLELFDSKDKPRSIEYRPRKIKSTHKVCIRSTGHEH